MIKIRQGFKNSILNNALATHNLKQFGPQNNLEQFDQEILQQSLCDCCPYIVIKYILMLHVPVKKSLFYHCHNLFEASWGNHGNKYHVAGSFAA